MKRTTYQVLVPLALLLLGGAGAAVLVLTREQPDTEEPASEAVPVEVVTVRSQAAEVAGTARGTVEAARRVQLVPHVVGPVVWVSDQLVPGAHLKEGEPLLRIDPRDYRLAVKARRGEVRAAELELRRARNRAEVAKEGWALFGSPEQGDRELALNLPQVHTAEQQLESARSSLEQAELDLSRTTARAPFACAVESTTATRGQRVGPQVPVATLVGSSRFWVRASVARQYIDQIAIPGVNGAEQGASVVVSQVLDGERVERRGKVLQLMPGLGEGGQMARVLIQVDDPLGLESDALRPLLLGSFVQVEIAARTLNDVLRVPRPAVRDSHLDLPRPATALRALALRGRGPRPSGFHRPARRRHRDERAGDRAAHDGAGGDGARVRARAPGGSARRYPGEPRRRGAGQDRLSRHRQGRFLRR